MREYIEREDLYEFLRDEAKHLDDMGMLTKAERAVYAYVLDVIHGYPAADVVPVVRRKDWIVVGNR